MNVVPACYRQCVIPENIHTSLQELEIVGDGRRFNKTKTFTEIYETWLEFLNFPISLMWRRIIPVIMLRTSIASAWSDLTVTLYGGHKHLIQKIVHGGVSMSWWVVKGYNLHLFQLLLDSRFQCLTVVIPDWISSFVESWKSMQFISFWNDFSYTHESVLLQS